MSKETKYVIKNLETGEYFVGWELVKNTKGDYTFRNGLSNGGQWNNVLNKTPKFSLEITPKIYNTHGGARKIISEFVGASFAKHDKMKPSEKILFGDTRIAKYEIVPCTIKIVEKKRAKKTKETTGGSLSSERPGNGPVLE